MNEKNKHTSANYQDNFMTFDLNILRQFSKFVITSK